MYRNLLPTALALALAAPAVAAPAAPAASAPTPAPAASAAAKPPLTSNSTFAEIFADPAAKATFGKVFTGFTIPDEFYDAVMGMPPRALQEFVPETFTDAALKKLDEELAKPPAPTPAAAAPTATARPPAAPQPEPAAPAPPTPRPPQ